LGAVSADRELAVKNIRAKRLLTAVLILFGLGLIARPAAAQNPPAAPPQAQEETPPAAGDDTPEYTPPLRGAPGGRVGGASRGTVKVVAPLPTVDLLAPDGESGETASAAPMLYYYASRPVGYPTRFTISAPGQPAPIIETTIPSATRAGIFAIRTGDLRVQLQPGVLYTWSVSLIVNPEAPSRDIVASASLLRVPPDPATEAALRNASPARRAELYARAGLWYDAVAAAADNTRALGALMQEVGLVLPVAVR
jgi:hypothetical protein